MNAKAMRTQLNRLTRDSFRMSQRTNDSLRRANPHIWNADHLVLSRMASKIEARVKEMNGTVLDIGSGNSPYRKYFTSAHYIGLDVGMGKGVSVFGDAHSLPLKSESIDALVSFQVFEHLEDPRLVANEMYRVLRPGGIMLITTHGIWPYHGHDFHRWTAEGLSLLMHRFSHVDIEPVGGPIAVCAGLLNHTLREAARVCPQGNAQSFRRLAAAGLVAALNGCALGVEHLCRRTSVYRALSNDMTDVYIVTGRKSAESGDGGEHPDRNHAPEPVLSAASCGSTQLHFGDELPRRRDGERKTEPR